MNTEKVHKMKNNMIDMIKKTKTIVTIEDFLELWENNKHKIKSTRILPPDLDDENDFGFIEVEHNLPIYEELFDE
ncbi:hypothetical protein GMMP13_100078 [Candidatus Magnetomoraceae bacterium gMMP-13]